MIDDPMALIIGPPQPHPPTEDVPQPIPVQLDESKRKASLKTSSRTIAEKRAKEIARSIAEARLTGRSLERLTLSEVFTVYFRERAPTLSARWKKSAETRRTLFEQAWGADRPVGDIGQADVDHFARLRMGGSIYAEETQVQKVRAGTVESDLRWLSTVFRWARGRKVEGRPLISSNPLEGLTRPKEKNVRRPIASPSAVRRHDG